MTAIFIAFLETAIYFCPVQHLEKMLADLILLTRYCYQHKKRLGDHIISMLSEHRDWLIVKEVLLCHSGCLDGMAEFVEAAAAAGDNKAVARVKAFFASR